MLALVIYVDLLIAPPLPPVVDWLIQIHASQSRASAIFSLAWNVLRRKKTFEEIEPTQHIFFIQHESFLTPKTNEKIAEALDLRPVSVQNHKARIMRKLGLHNTVDLIRYAMQKGFVNQTDFQNRYKREMH